MSGKEFGPTLAREKLLEAHRVSVALETLRIWMIEGGIWQTRKERRKRAIIEDAGTAGAATLSGRID